MPRPAFVSARARRAVRIDDKSSSAAFIRLPILSNPAQRDGAASLWARPQAQGQFVAVIGPLLPRTLSHSWSWVVVRAMTVPCRSLQVARATTVTA